MGSKMNEMRTAMKNRFLGMWWAHMDMAALRRSFVRITSHLRVTGARPLVR